MAAALPEVALSVRGRIYEGWKQVSIRSSLEELAHSFSCEYTQRAEVGAAPIEIETDDKVEVSIGGKRVLTGYVDLANEDYDASSHSVSVSGRSETGRLVKGAAIFQGGAIKGKNLYDVAKLLCEPYGIGVSIDTALSDMFLSTGSEPAVQIQDGDSVFQTLSELARKDAVLLLTTPTGDLLLARASTIPSGVVLTNTNIKRGSLRQSSVDRHSSYLIKGQASGSDALSALSTNGLKFELVDDEVTSYCPFVAVEHDATLERLQQRALWERNTRAGQGSGLVYDVQGWTHSGGRVWLPNTLLHVTDARLGIDADMLVASVDLQRSLDSGRIARLELAPRETYDVLRPPKRLKKKKGDLSRLLPQ